MRPLFCLLLFLAACFPIDSDKVILRCDSDHPCPSGQVCLSNNTCGMGDADLGTSAGDMGMASGCVMPGGTPVGSAFACPVNQLGTGQASALCASGYKLCTSATPLQSDPQCKQLDRFYAAEVPGGYTGVPGQVSAINCGSMVGQYRAFFGCGKLNLPIVHQVTACQGFERVIDCQASGSGWTCQGTLNASSTTVPAGVLCCP